MSIAIAPLAHRTATWMTDNKVVLGVLKLHQLALPSAHNAGVDKKGVSGPAEGWIACQRDSFLYQLRGGIRVLDLRILKVSQSVYHFYHGPFHSVRRVENLISDCLKFYKEGNGARDSEYIILDIGKTSAKTGDYEIDYVRKLLLDGLSDRVLPASAARLTLRELREQYPGRTIILYGEGGDPFGGKITRDWVGEDTPSVEEIKRYIHSKINSADYPPRYLRSLQVVKYSHLYGPETIEAELDKWFAPLSSWLSKTNIINVDFFEASNIVQNCIATSLANARPPTPENVRVGYDREYGSLHVTFDRFRYNYTVTHFIVTLDGVPSRVEHKPNSTQHVKLYQRFGPDRNYVITVRAVSTHGRESGVVKMSGNTGKDIPGRITYVGHSRELGSEGDSIIVGWMKTLPFGVRYEAVIYKADAGRKTIGPAIEMKSVLITGMGVIFKGLTPGQGYVIHVFQVSGAGHKGEIGERFIGP
ncbi:hypothetical protein J3P89_10170 [Pseudomonas sp. Z1-14]|uniref:hypothetical protein n=1 Tax=Pseudomonas sp. Z1-14 TaxID=2817409 RepID=UPI003DA81897